MKIKLRDLTAEQYEEWLKNNCATKTLCGDCPFFKVICNNKNRCWVNNKELYSDKFLDQEIEIYVPILTDEEREYLRAVIKPFRKRVVGIAKTSYRTLGEKIVIMFENFETLMLPFFKSGTIYKGMQLDTPYTLEDLGL